MCQQAQPEPEGRNPSGPGQDYGSVREAMDEVQMVVEGVYSAKAGWELSQKYQVDTPIIQQVNQVLFDGKEPGLAVQDLMLRDKKIESWEVSWE